MKNFNIWKEYYARADKAREEARVDPDVWNRMWLQLILDSGWSFKDTMAFIQESLSASPAVGVHLSIALSEINAIWKHWFFAEFPDFVRDLNLDPKNRDIPFPWVTEALQNARRGMNAYSDDKLFELVPWRSCYMWTHAYRRLSGKYYADFFFKFASIMLASVKNPPFVLSDSDGRDSVVVSEENGKTKVEVFLLVIKNVGDKISMETRMTSIDEALGMLTDKIQWEGEPSIVYKTWVLRQACMNAMTEVPKTGDQKQIRVANEVFRSMRTSQEGHFYKTIQFRTWPNVGKDRHLQQQGMFKYSFVPASVESFIVWILIQMVHLGKLPDVENPDSHWKSLTELFASMDTLYLHEQKKLLTGSIEGGAKTRQLERYDPVLKKFYWFYLEHFGLCPRRIDTRDPEQRAVQFLGNQIE